MQLTQRCQYALRALFELARRAQGQLAQGQTGQGQAAGDGMAGPALAVVSAADIAQAQAIPKRFLDGILLELRQAGFVESRRGKAGGFVLARPAEEITVGQVIRLYNGAMAPVDCRAGGREPCPLLGGCVFSSVWDQARAALEGVYDAISLAELVARDRRLFPAPLA